MNRQGGALCHDASTAEVCTALELELRRHWGSRVSIATLERTPADYQSSFALEELEIELDGGQRVTLMFKNLGALLEDAARIKPAFVVDNQREIEVYRRVLAPNGIGPLCYSSVASDPANRHWLFVEKIQGRLLWQVGEFEVWLETARWLARMHARVGGLEPLMVEQSRLLRYDAALCGRWAERAVSYASGNNGAATLLRHVASRYTRVLDRMAALPVSFVHGEFYASNILVAGDGDALRVYPVDWEMAGVGSGLLDLAALVSGHWEADERRALGRAYFDELRGGPLAPAHEADLQESLAWCRLHVAVQWLGWSEHWSPPKEHAHDWLRDVSELAETLEL